MYFREIWRSVTKLYLEGKSLQLKKRLSFRSLECNSNATKITQKCNFNEGELY